MTPNEEHIAFYYEIGMALTQWAHVESDLCAMVLSFFNAHDHQALALGFFSIENFRSKLHYAERVVSKKLHETKHLDEWAKLIDRVRTGSEQRNQLVHRHVLIYPASRPGKRFALLPWIGSKPKSNAERSRPPAGSLFLRDVIKYRYNFFSLVVSLSNFSARVHGRKEPFLTGGEQPKNPPTIVQIRRQIHALFGHQLKSSRERRKEEDAKNAASSLLATEVDNAGSKTESA